MPTDPSNPKSPNPYQTTSSTPNKGGGGGVFFVILLVLLLGGGAAYYFLSYKPNVVVPMAEATPKPTATPSAAPKAAPTPTGYDKATRQQYIQTAIDAFKALRQSKYQPFSDAFKAFSSAGGLSAAGLTTKDAVAARRNLITQCLTANDDYTAFIKTQDTAYTAELKKTLLTPNDVEVESSYTAAKMPTDKIVQLRTIQSDSLKTADQMLAYLDSKFGSWSVSADKHLIFKKAADGSPFSALAKTYGEQVTALNKLRDEINANSPEDPTASSTAPAGTPVPAATAAPSAAAAPSVAP